MPKPCIKKSKKLNWIPEQTIIDTVGCRKCGARKTERCHRFSRRGYTERHGPPCGPHQVRVALYRQWRKAQKMTRQLTPA